MKNLYKKLKDTSRILKDDEKPEFISTGIISLNLLFSGLVVGGIPVGKVSMMAAPESQGKSFVGLSILKNAQKKKMNTIVIDTESAFDFEWAKKIGIDISEEKLLIIQSNSIEDIQTDILNILKDLSRKEKQNTLFLVDSIGGLVTSKTLDDATLGHDKKDMTITQKKNMFSRIMMGTNATFFMVNHVYDNIGGFGDVISISGGRGLKYTSSCTVVGISKAKDKNQDEISGHIISCKTVKSRYGKEESKLQFRIKNEGGLDTFYGILKDALEGGYVDIPSKGFYTRMHIKNDKKIREKDIYNKDFWLPIFKETDFKKYLENKYSFKSHDIDISNFEISEEINEINKK